MLYNPIRQVWKTYNLESFIMGSLLLAVIYLIFISLGLPDSLLGSGWPKMQIDFGVPSSYAGYISMTISFMTIISALLSPRMIRKLRLQKHVQAQFFRGVFSVIGKDHFERKSRSSSL